MIAPAPGRPRRVRVLTVPDLDELRELRARGEFFWLDLAGPDGRTLAVTSWRDDALNAGWRVAACASDAIRTSARSWR